MGRQERVFTEQGALDSTAHWPSGQDGAVVALCPLAPAPQVQEKRLFPSWLRGAGGPVTSSAPRLTSAWIMSV